MVAQYSAPAVRALGTLKQCRLRVRSHPQRRPFSTLPLVGETGFPSIHNTQHNGRRQISGTVKSKEPKSIAVLGGGLTGLATAWYITRFMPHAKVTIYESSGRLGGWLDTETVNVTGLNGEKGTIQFERGARMVKPYGITKWDDLAFYEMVAGLNLQNEVWVKETDPARFIYYPDHLVSLPNGVDFSVKHNGVAGTIQNMIRTLQMTVSEPLFDKLYPSMFSYLSGSLRESQREALWDDTVSVGDYFAAAFGGRRELVDNTLSAMMHGVYGGDVWKLGLASNSLVTPGMRAKSILLEMLKEKGIEDPGNTMAAVKVQDARLIEEISEQPETVGIMQDWAFAKALGFKKGFGTLVDALARNLTKNPNVKVDHKTVTGVRLNENGKMEVICFIPHRLITG